MNRAIEFRTWDKQRKKMFYDIQDQYDGYPHQLVPSSFGECLEDNDFKIMQYIGLKDKHGKKIFEGDRVECYHRSFNKTGEVGDELRGCRKVRICEYHSGRFYFVNPEGRDMSYWDVSRFTEGFGYKDGSCEVIGNIYDGENNAK